MNVRPAHLEHYTEVTLAADVVLSAGMHEPRLVPAGSRVLVHPTRYAQAGPNGVVVVYAPGCSGRYRVSGVVYRKAIA